VLAEVGYHESNVRLISQRSGYSRASFYQYFSGKEDLFRQLSGHVARLLARTTDGVGPLTPDASGRDALRAWLGHYADLYRDFAPVFVAFQTAAASDESVASGGARVAVRTFGTLRSRVTGSPLASRQVDYVIRALPGVTVRLNRYVGLLRSLGVEGGIAAPGRMDDAIADVFHRALFGVVPAANVHAPPSGTMPGLPTVPPIDAATDLAGDPSLGPGARRTRAQLIEAGDQAFAEKGYYATRVADVAAKAGLSHGIFYRYFDNKTHLFRLIAERASVRLAATFGEIPVLVGPGAGRDVAGELRAWLTRYTATYAAEAAIFSMWSEAMSRDPELAAVSASVTETQREACASVLAPRGYGDVEAEALVMIMILDGMTAQRPTPSRIEVTAQMMERALLQPLPS
jgi:AcrR family transcriptional regulator